MKIMRTSRCTTAATHFNFLLQGHLGTETFAIDVELVRAGLGRCYSVGIRLRVRTILRIRWYQSRCSFTYSHDYRGFAVVARRRVARTTVETLAEASLGRRTVRWWLRGRRLLWCCLLRLFRSSRANILRIRYLFVDQRLLRWRWLDYCCRCNRCCSDRGNRGIATLEEFFGFWNRRRRGCFSRWFALGIRVKRKWIFYSADSGILVRVIELGTLLAKCLYYLISSSWN